MPENPPPPPLAAIGLILRSKATAEEKVEILKLLIK